MAADASEINEKLRLLRQSYIDELPSKINKIRESWTRFDSARNAQDLEALIRLCHNLAGSGATFGFPGLSAQARALEERLRVLADDAGQTEPARRDELQTQVDALIEAGQASLSQPWDIPGPSPLPGAAKPTASFGDKLVYLVEDEHELAARLALQLRRFGYVAEIFASPLEVPAAVAERAPVAVLMDIMFPEGPLAGFEAAAKLQHARDWSVPVIFISSRNDLAARLDAVRAGGVAYFSKPVDVGALVDKLDALIEQRPDEPARVLVVDDSPTLAAYYGTVLQEQGMEVEVVSELADIIKLLDQFRPDLILLDLYMPGCDGVELAAVIRQKADFVSTPIVYLSAETNMDTQLQALRSGGDDFLTKPIEPRHLVAAVSTRVKRARQLRGFMVRDSLTGLLNHTTIKEQLELEFARCQREQRPLSFAMIDIDHFKQVNDRHGHVVGDRVIKSLSRMLRDRLRASDVVGRYGGEEFAVVLSGADATQAERLLNAIREDFAAIQHTSEHGVFSVSFSVSFSGGIAALPGYSESSQMSEAADKALYAAKHGGRNRIELAGPGPA